MSQPSAGQQTPNQAPKRSHAGRNALLASGAGALILVIAIAIAGPGETPGASLPVVSTPPTAPVSTPASTTPKTPPTTVAKPTTTLSSTRLPETPNKVTVRKIGAEFTVGRGGFVSGKYTVLAGWTLKSIYGNPTFTGRVKNVDEDKAIAPTLQLKFLNGSDLLMTVNCAANELEPGQATKLNCYSTDDYTTAYKTIVAETGL